MKTFVHPALVIACLLLFSGAAVAKGSGGHGSGGHASGGHGSSGHGSGGGHAGAGHSSGGHGSSGGHASSGSTHGSSHGNSAPRSSAGGASTSAASAAAATPSSGYRAHRGVIVDHAVPRTTAPDVTRPLPSSPFVVFGQSRFSVGYGRVGLYDPFWRGYGFGYSGYGYGYNPAPLYPGYGYAPDPFDRTGPTGSIRLNVEPRDAVVHVDGYYAGIVDDFDGHFQHLNLTPGPHHIEISAPGYQQLVIDVAIQPRHGIEYRGALTR